MRSFTACDKTKQHLSRLKWRVFGPRHKLKEGSITVRRIRERVLLVSGQAGEGRETWCDVTEGVGGPGINHTSTYPGGNTSCGAGERGRRGGGQEEHAVV